MNRKKVLISRQQAVKKLIQTYAIEDQAAFIELLNKYYDIAFISHLKPYFFRILIEELKDINIYIL